MSWHISLSYNVKKHSFITYFRHLQNTFGYYLACIMQNEVYPNFRSMCILTHFMCKSKKGNLDKNNKMEDMSIYEQFNNFSDAKIFLH